MATRLKTRAVNRLSLDSGCVIVYLSSGRIEYVFVIWREGRCARQLSRSGFRQLVPQRLPVTLSLSKGQSEKPDNRRVCAGDRRLTFGRP